jgi:hypothetical protein
MEAGDYNRKSTGTQSPRHAVILRDIQMRGLTVAVFILAAPALARDSSGSGGGDIDLLKLVLPKKHAVLGTWTVEKGVLHSALGPSQPFRLELPYAPGDEYDLRVVVERKEGNPPFVVGFPVGDRQVTLDVDGWGGSDTCGISVIDGKSGEGNETRRVGKLLVNDRPSTIACLVRKDGIRIVVDGVKVIDWKGERSRLSLWPGWTMPHRNTPFVATWGGRFDITRISLTPRSGRGSPLR